MVIIETSVFTRQVRELLSDEEYRELQIALVNRPHAGSVIKGSGGLRKVRWAVKGEANAAASASSITGQLPQTNCSCSLSTARANAMT